MARLKPREVEAALNEDKPPRSAAQLANDERLRNNPPRKKLHSVSPKKTIEPMEMKTGQDHPRAMKSTGPAKDALEPARIEPVGRPVDKEKLAMLAFMEDMVTIYIQPTTDPAAAFTFDIYNNGRACFFNRGETRTVKRYFVEGLARAKHTSYTQKKIRGPDGVEQYVYEPHTAPRYAFSVIHDPHPRGKDWLEHVLAEA